MSDALVVTLLVKCSEMKLVAFAESIVQHIRAKQKMTIAMYSALMKVATRAVDDYGLVQKKGHRPIRHFLSQQEASITSCDLVWPRNARNFSHH